MSEPLPGQLSLFEGPYFLATYKDGVPNPLVLFECWRDRQELAEPEVCDECGTCCTSSRECVEASGLYEEDV